MDIASIRSEKGTDLRLFMRKLGCVICEHMFACDKRLRLGTTNMSYI